MYFKFKCIHRSAGLVCPMHGPFCPKNGPFCPERGPFCPDRGPFCPWSVLSLVRYVPNSPHFS